MVMLAQTLQSARYRAVCTICGTVDGDIEIGLGVLDHHILAARKANLNLAALVAPAARPVDVRQSHGDFAHIMVGPAQGELQASPGVLAQAIRQNESAGLNVDAHEHFSLSVEHSIDAK